MNTFSKVIIAGLVSVGATAGVANAVDFGAAGVSDSHENLQRFGDLPTPASADGYGYGYKAGFVSKAVANDGVTIRRANELSRAHKSEAQNASANDPRVQALQSEIRQDASLVKAFDARGINIDNVVGSYTPLSGNTVYIVR